MKNLSYYLLSMSMLILCSSVSAQLTLPPSGNNQKSMVTQYIGSTAHVSITYSSPRVNGREGKIWGQLVPYGMAPNNFGSAKEIPWRAGANENTTITLSHDMEVNGKSLSAGTYGLHLIPKENAPWTVIFSNTTNAWGSYFYDEREDALRVEATAKESSFHEYLVYEFTDKQPNQTTLEMQWENIALPITFTVPDNMDLQIDIVREELKGEKGFQWQNYVSAVNFLVSANENLEEALAWADYAISAPFVGISNFQTLSAKSSVLAAMGKTDEASSIMDEAIKLPSTTVFEIHNYGRQLLNQNNVDRALEVLNYNYKRFDGAWPTAVGLMRAYSAKGDFDNAMKYGEISVDQAPDELNKNYLKGAVEKLKNKEKI